MFLPKPKWDVDQIPDLSGKIMVVTGGNTGIGKETVKSLLTHNATVYIAGRNPQKVQEAIDDLRGETGKAACFCSSTSPIRARSRMPSEQRLDVLFNSAGLIYPAVYLVTKDGYDMQFGANVIAITAVIASTNTSPDGKARVIKTFSVGHSFVSGIDFDTIRDGPKRTKAGTMKLYSQSKFANVVLLEQGIVSVSLYPGNLKTDLQRHISKIEAALTKFTLYPAPMGALTQLYAGTMPEGANLGGQYLIPWARVGKAKKDTADPDAGRKLWEWLENATRTR
ncbi:NAD(P)-binding protein [Polyporus arcularius HHB13444]|uniref:NAD(P)-binding protein n=1 Tax=Polyporus arcularius HHB13444 TaxID=1314778 RepID=A0A5C3PY30_9APHY|nr:NAD(P)-binding protein [Polyporus arcularius HHB13444]